MISAASIISAVLIVIIVIGFSKTSQSTYTLEGYGHAVAFCKVYQTKRKEFQTDKTKTVKENDYMTLVINTGHENDPQITTIEEKATQYCKDYKESLENSRRDKTMTKLRMENIL